MYPEYLAMIRIHPQPEKVEDEDEIPDYWEKAAELRERASAGMTRLEQKRFQGVDVSEPLSTKLREHVAEVAAEAGVHVHLDQIKQLQVGGRVQCRSLCTTRFCCVKDLLLPLKYIRSCTPVVTRVHCAEFVCGF